MSIEIREVREYDFADNDVVWCIGKHSTNVIATLIINDYQKIPLCEDCLKFLLEDAQRVSNMVFCYKCKYFEANKYGVPQGTCKLHNRDRDYENTCKDGELNE